jgi:DNA-binding transcriptional ArsR family regulator
VRLLSEEVHMEESVAALQLAYHISLARLGRRRLGLRTGLTEMTVRIQLERLRDRGLVRLQRSGVELTTAGRRRFGKFLEPIRSIAEVELTSLRVDDVSLAAHLATGDTGPVWALRDEAVREGATGLLLLRFDPDGWRFAHNDEPIRLHNPQDTTTMATIFPDPHPEDLLLIASGPDLRSAGLGLWRALLTVLAASS